MPNASEWLEICAAIRGGDPAAERRLYDAAVKDGSRALGGCTGGEDLVHDVLAKHWDAILNADFSPKAFFLVVLTRHSISVHRKNSPFAPGRQAADFEAQTTAYGSSGDGISVDLVRALDWIRSHLQPRDQRVFVMRRLQNVPSAAVAAAEGLTVANVDQIVSRATKSLKGAFS